MEETKDPRFRPIKVEEGIALIPDEWKIDFWASTGELSRFYTELKENARIMGTRCPRCDSLYVWPRSWCPDCYCDCEWVEVEGKGELTVFSRVEVSLSEIKRDVPFYQGGVLLDGARYAIVVILKPERFEDLRVGMRVKARFLPPEERTGRTRDLYFVPDE